MEETTITFEAARAALRPLVAEGGPHLGLYAPDPARSITGILPAALGAIGAHVPAGRRSLAFPAARPAEGDRLLCVFLDSLGLDLLLDPATPDGPFRRLLPRRGTIATSVFPSITSAAATSIYTGLDPVDHGIPGHKIRVTASGPVVDVLKMEDADTGRPAGGRVVASLARQVSPQNLLGTAAVPAISLLPSRFSDSGLSRAIFPRNVRREGYVGLPEAFAKARAYLERHDRIAIVLYVPDLDDAAHIFAPRSDECRAVVGFVERNLALCLRRLDARVRAGTLVALASDHGQSAYARREVTVTRAARRRLAEAGIEAVGTSGRFLHAYLARGADRAGARAALGRVLGDDIPVLDGAGRRQGDLLAPMPPATRLVVEWGRPKTDRGGELFRDAANHGSMSAEEVLVPALLAPADEVVGAT